MEFRTRECLEPKVRSPANDRYGNQSLDDIMPPRPAKRSTPRPGVCSVLYQSENGTFAPHRIRADELLRTESVWKAYFVDCNVLGVGTYGTVYDAKYRVNGERYAVKLFVRRGREPVNELEQAAFLQAHPHVNCLRYYFAWADKKFDEFGIVTELCDGGSLKSILDARCLNEEEVWNFFLDLLEGLAHIHAHKVRHFDIKPANLFVTGRGQLRIGDFGVAVPLGSSHEHGRGHRPYAAPETITDGSLEAVGTAADMYSAGVVLYEMVTDYDVMQDARRWQEPPPEREFATLTRLCGTLMAQAPHSRPSAQQVLDLPDVRERAARRRAQGVVLDEPAPPPFPAPEELWSECRPADSDPAGTGEKVSRSLFNASK